MISQDILIEAAVMGAVSYMIGTILMKFMKKDDPKNNKPAITFQDKLVMFLIGAVTHILLKKTKMDDWYCKRIAVQSLAQINPVRTIQNNVVGR